MKILGLDRGASFTKAVILENRRLVYKKIITQADSLPSYNQKASAQALNEFNCLGQGGLWLAKKSQAVVVSCGTGTSIVLAKKNKPSIHLGGTGVGGGILLGLGKLILKTDSAETIFSLANTGDKTKVNLTVGDILGHGIGLLPADATAANFGKIKSEKIEDLAAGLINLIAETIGMVACLAAKTAPETNLIFVGRLAANQLIQAYLKSVCDLFKFKAIFPQNAVYATAIGAALTPQSLSPVAKD